MKQPFKSHLMARTFKIDCSKLPVMKAHCATCLFKPDANGRWRDTQLANDVIGRTLFQGHQICHGTETGPKRTPHNRCKGAYDHNMKIYKRMGVEKHIK